MKDWYFHQERGKTLGPITLEEVKSRIHAGRIRLTDLLFRDGEPGWRMALEFPDLRGEFKSASLEALSERPWVCLQRKAADSSDFVTLGPFSEADVKSAIQAGRIAYGDYAWREGFNEWKRIGSLAEFNRRLQKDPAAPPPLPEIPSGPELLKNVVEFKRPKPATPEPPPPEASMDDELTVIAPFLPKVPVETPEERSEPKVPEPFMDDEKTRIHAPDTPPLMDDEKTRIHTESKPHSLMDDEKTTLHTPLDLPKDDAETVLLNPVLRPNDLQSDIMIKMNPRLDKEIEPEQPVDLAPADEPLQPKPSKAKSLLVDWGIVAGLVMMLIAAIFAVSSYVSAPPAQKPEPVVAVPVDEPVKPRPEPPAPKAAEPVGNDSAVAPAEEVPQARAQTDAKKPPPTELNLAVQTISNTAVRIEVQTDATAEYPVYVQIVGLPGQVTDGASFYRYLRFIPKGEGMRPIDLSGLRLPQGRFYFRVATGDHRKEAKVSVGVNEPTYRETVARLRKQHAHQIWRERLALFKLATELEKAISDALLGKRFNPKAFPALAAVSRAKGGDYAMFDDWWELREIMLSAQNGATAATLGRLKKERDRLSSFSVWK